MLHPEVVAGRPAETARAAWSGPRKSHRWLDTLTRFPVAFRSRLAALPFRVTALFMLFYTALPHIGGSAAVYAKYLYAGVMLSVFGLLALTQPRINLLPRFPLALLLLAALGCVSLAYATFVVPGTTTYSSALIPLIVVAIPLLIATRHTRADTLAAIDYLTAIYCFAALCYVMWQAAARGLGWEEGIDYFGSLEFPWLTGTISLVFLTLLCGLLGRDLLLVLSVGLIGVSLVLRPTSTLAFAAVFAGGFVAAHRLRLRRLLRLGCILAAGTIIVANFMVLYSARVADALYSIEPAVKQQTLAAQDDNEFRLGVLSAARDEIAHHSLLIGKGFVGDVTVDPLPYLPFLATIDPSSGTAVTIHSDFAIVAVQGGLIGYALFACLFIGVALSVAKGAGRAAAAGDRVRETLFDTLQAMNIVAMLYMSGNPMLQDLQDAMPYLISVPLAVFLFRSGTRDEPAAAASSFSL